MAFTRRPSLIGVAALAALTLTACGSADGEDSSASPTAGVDGGTAADLEALESVTWTDGDGGVPELEFEVPLGVAAPAVLKVTDGDGETIELGNSISVDYTVTNTADNSLLYSTYDVGQTETLSVAEGALDPILLEAFEGSTVGSTYLYAAPDAQNPDGTVLMALTVQSRTEVLDRAEGTAVEPAEGLPEVSLADNGAPSVEIPSEDPPAELIVQPLIEGDGAVVPEGASISAHYTGWLWTGDQFDSSWERGAPATFPLDGVIQGWSQGLAGQTVGSQVLLVIPPELGYGDEDAGQGGIPGGSTLVFVVDILGVQ